MTKHKYTGIKVRIGNRYSAQITIDGQRIGCSERTNLVQAAKDYDLLCIKYGREPKNGFYTKLTKL